MLARSSVHSKQGTSANVSVIGFVKVHSFESNEDRAMTVLKLKDFSEE